MTVKPLFSAIAYILHENNRITKDNKKTSYTLNKYFLLNNLNNFE